MNKKRALQAVSEPQKSSIKEWNGSWKVVSLPVIAFEVGVL
ncbi:hypothetical protein [Vagococcus allomyrinae]|nr:hypothetical protein [Vagococcus allomyrinae]